MSDSRFTVKLVVQGRQFSNSVIGIVDGGCGEVVVRKRLLSRDTMYQGSPVPPPYGWTPTGNNGTGALLWETARPPDSKVTGIAISRPSGAT